MFFEFDDITENTENTENTEKNVSDAGEIADSQISESAVENEPETTPDEAETTEAEPEQEPADGQSAFEEPEESEEDSEYDPDVVVEDTGDFRNEIVIYQTDDGSVALDVPLENETV